MTTDLTPFFHEAKRKQALWTYETRIRTVERILNAVQDAVDLRDNEDWHWIIRGEELVAYLRLNFPLVFIGENYAQILRFILETEPVVVIFVSDWNLAEYSLDPSTIDLFFPQDGWHTDPDIVSPNHFDISGLIYATI